jgi:hypothetical protein
VDRDTSESPPPKLELSATEKAGVVEELAFIASRIVASDWIAIERREYADHKYDADLRYKNDIDMHNFGLTEESDWWVFLTNYLRRAQVFGVDTLQGRQAFGKFVVTALSAFESMIRTEGRPPTPGVHSGEITEWDRGKGNEDG